MIRPERFQGSRVRVIGSISLQFESNVLCPREDSPSAECLWLDLEGLSDPGFRSGAALVEATFDGENRGHLGCCAGTLHTITRCERWRDERTGAASPSSSYGERRLGRAGVAASDDAQPRTIS